MESPRQAYVKAKVKPASIRERTRLLPFRGLNMQAETTGFAVCLDNACLVTSLEARKFYPVVTGPDTKANGLVRVIDESGEDYLYDPQRALRAAS
ncbi:MAG TPA: hypothetical protein VK789_12650 [Bryobacteraceae bacterium]|nr:hypothetical protein [Bryobacteraceae bacterium]